MEPTFKFKKTRIAPTPSGFLHLGNVVSFVRTVGLAKETGAKVLLRIDDMDRVRVMREYLQDIFDTLNFLEIPWDEGPRDVDEFEREYSQVHRMGLYRDGLRRLREGGKVFACGCSRLAVLRDGMDRVYAGTCRKRGLDLDREDVSWRLRTGERGLDMRGIGESLDGWREVLIGVRVPDTMKDFVVRKRDRLPAYQLTSVMDDLYYGVDLVVRGMDLLDSTVAQLYLAEQLGKGAEFGSIGFHLHELLRTEEGRKLSKSAGDTSIQYLRKQGMKKEDIYEMLARMMEVGGMLKTGEAEEVRNWEQLYNQLYE